MNKNAFYIFIVLLITGAIGNIYADDYYENLERERQLNDIERKVDGLKRSKHSSNIQAQNQQIKKNHNNSIVSAHPDYNKIVYGQEFPQWIGAMPPKEIIRAKDIVYRGTADEINQLLTGYKGNYIPPILKRERQVANSILGIKKKRATPRKNVDILDSFTGILNNLTPQTINQIQKNRRKLGMVNKKEILLLIDDYAKLNNEKKKEENLHYSTIANVHPDYQEISNDPKFYEFINNLPEEKRKICNAIVDGGSAEEVNALLSAYKQSIRVESTYIENTDQTTDKISNAYTVGQIVKLNNPSDDSVAFYKDSSLKDITILFTNGVRAKVIEIKGSNTYKVKVGEHIGWVSGNVLK
ncbi:MAG: hypothetical protein ACE5GU_00615 [Candidatus Scalinduaceae bacterium]